MKAYRGGCTCGEIRYISHAAPRLSLHCYCRQCQRATGAGHASQMALPVAAITITGTLRFYETTAASGNKVSSGFCPTCGGPILKKSAGHPDMIFIHAATLDDPSRFTPQMVVWGESRQPWDCLDPALS